MGFNHFSLLIGVRVSVLTMLILTLVYMVLQHQYYVGSALVFAVIVMVIWELVSFVSKTNAQLTRFVDAMRYGDFGQRFDTGLDAAGFGELGQSFSQILANLNAARSEQEANLAHLKALVEHVPVPLVSIYHDDRVVMHNNAARRLFAGGKVTKLNDLGRFGDEIVQQMRQVLPGERRLTSFEGDEVSERLTIAATEIIQSGRTEKLVSLQSIQGELDVAQLQAWQDLVRVLTHEIMNSLTPVSSLAKTSLDLVNHALENVYADSDAADDLNDAREAVTAVARRSDGLMQFVESYRQLTRVPVVNKAPVALEPLLERSARLAQPYLAEAGIELDCSVVPKDLTVDMDAGLVEQVLLNLLKNAAFAVAGRKEGGEKGYVQLQARINRRSRAVIEVTDNGPGIDEDLAKQIFVPFFTTKTDGTGVGLALTRQVMIAHGGNVSLSKSDSDGARFTLTF